MTFIEQLAQLNIQAQIAAALSGIALLLLILIVRVSKK